MSICPICNFTLYVTQSLHFFENHPCTVCTKFDKTGTFITGCKNYKRDSINQHEKSESHKVNVIKFNGQKNPQNSEGANALQ